MSKLIYGSAREQRLLKLHHEHVGLYGKIAKELGVSAAYVSLVVNGKRRSDRVTRGVIAEIKRNHVSIRSALRGL